MAHYRRVRTLSLEAAAYIAGLIDGEGTVTLSRTHSNENRRVVVSIANTELALLSFVLEQAGAGKITRKRVVSDLHSPSYCYAICSAQAVALLSQLAPHLRSYKRKRAELILAKYRSLTPRNGKYSLAQLSARRDFEQQLLDTKPHRT